MFASVWITVLSFEALLFTIAIAFILLAMAKERTEYRHKTAALIDPLTGIANRRAFLQDGEVQLKRQTTEPRPMAVMLLDLDNFKCINDRFGHAIGDRVLQLFAEVGSGCMRRVDLFGRLGGEEFAALLVDTSRERALAVAEQIRSSFVEVTGMVEGKPVVATVSIGVVISYDAVLDLSALLGASRPRALSRQGQRPEPHRNRLDRADPRPGQARQRRRRPRGQRQSGGEIRRLTPANRRSSLSSAHFTSAGVEVAGPSPTMSRTASSSLAPSKCTCWP